MDKLKISGVWWDPKNDKEQASGALTFDNENGGRLTLIGALGGLRAFNGDEGITIIHGIADNKFITLYKSYTRSLSTNFPGPHKHIIDTGVIFIGRHLSEDEMVFNKVNIDFTYLPEFISKSSLSYSMHFDKTRQHAKGLSAEVKSQKPHYIGPVPNGKISATYGWGQQGVPFRSVTLKEQCALMIELTSSITLNELIATYVRPLQDLVTLATDLPNAITRLEVQNPNILNEHNQNPKTLEVYQRTFADPPESKKKSLMRYDMLFTLNDLKKTKINKWINVAQYYRPAVAILFGQRYAKVNLENKLLNSVSAIEAYHRRKFKNNLSGKVVWSKRLERILRGVNERDKVFLNEKLSYANDKNLIHRLDEVLAQSGLMSDLISNPEKWNKLIRKYRNALTHYDPSSPKEITDYQSVHWLAESLAWILLACLMTEIGFTKTEVCALVNDNQRYVFMKQRMNEVLK
jgi:hypothetical protein